MSDQFVAVRSVYLISLGELHKIGSSIDPVVRLDQVAPGGRVVHCFPSTDAYQVERALQRRFGHCLVEGMGREWFRLSQEDIDLICRLARVDTVDDLPSELQPTTEKTTSVVRIPADLARMASIVAIASGRDVAAVLSPLLRDSLEREYAETVQQLIQETQQGE